MAGAGRHPQRRLMQLVLAMQWRLPWLCSQQEPPRPGNLTECMNWYDRQCPTCRCSTLLTVGYTCDSFAPGTEFQACEPPDLSRSLPVCLSVSVVLLVPPSRTPQSFAPRAARALQTATQAASSARAAPMSTRADPTVCLCLSASVAVAAAEAFAVCIQCTRAMSSTHRPDAIRATVAAPAAAATTPLQFATASRGTRASAASAARRGTT